MKGLTSVCGHSEKIHFERFNPPHDSLVMQFLQPSQILVIVMIDSGTELAKLMQRVCRM